MWGGGESVKDPSSLCLFVFLPVMPRIALKHPQIATPPAQRIPENPSISDGRVLRIFLLLLLLHRPTLARNLTPEYPEHHLEHPEDPGKELKGKIG